MNIQPMNGDTTFKQLKGIRLTGEYRTAYEARNVNRIVKSIQSNKIFQDIFSRRDGYIVLDKQSKTYNSYAANVAHAIESSLSICFDLDLGFWSRLLSAGRSPMLFKLIQANDYQCRWDGIKFKGNIEDKFNNAIRYYDANQFNDDVNAIRRANGDMTNQYEFDLQEENNIENNKQNFMDIMDKFNIDSLYEPKDILAILKDKELKNNFSMEDCFNYKLSDDSQDTLLTKFLDIIPTEENQKDYDKILNIMKKTKNIDYNQVDSNGISVIEKIMNSENLAMLDLVKDFDFNYSREMDYAYERIDNKEFKDKVKNLNINFPNVKEAIRLNSTEALQELLPEFKSPFFNTKKLVSDLSGKVSINNLNNAITFLEDNGIDTAGVIL